jgi:glycosyltransferase involved in cell wall biosynthesis
MADDLPVLSIVCPAFDEDEVLPTFHAGLVRAVEPLAGQYRIEVVYVDDGSRDGTLPVLRYLAATDDRVRYLSLSRNFGHQAALTAGLEHARGDAVVSLDSDGQHPPELIPTLVEQWRAGHDVVVTIRATDRRLGWFKRVTSAVFYKLLGRCTDIEVRAAASDFRLLSRRATDALLRLRESHRYLRGMVQWLGFPVAEVPFTPSARAAGTSKYTLRRMLRLAGDGLFSFSRLPLRLSVSAGLVATALSLLVSVAMAVRRFGPVDPLLVALVVAVHVIGGCLFAALGVLGEYVGRIHEQAKDRPLYVVRESWPPAAGEDEAVRPVHGRSKAA